MVRGRTTAQLGLVLGHEITGEVIEDPGAADATAKIGNVSIRFGYGLGWAKSHSFHTGQTPVMNTTGN